MHAWPHTCSDLMCVDMCWQVHGRTACIARVGTLRIHISSCKLTVGRAQYARCSYAESQRGTYHCGAKHQSHKFQSDLQDNVCFGICGGKTRMQWVLGAPGGFLCNVYTHTYNVLQRAVGPARHTHRQHSDRCIVLVGV